MVGAVIGVIPRGPKTRPRRTRCDFRDCVDFRARSAHKKHLRCTSQAVSEGRVLSRSGRKLFDVDDDRLPLRTIPCTLVFGAGSLYMWVSQSRL